MNNTIPNPPIVKVSWIDCSIVSDWLPLAEAIESEPMHCTSVGYVLRNDDVVLVLAQTLSSEDTATEVLSIPAESVIEAVQLA